MLSYWATERALRCLFILILDMANNEYFSSVEQYSIVLNLLEGRAKHCRELTHNCHCEKEVLFIPSKTTS